MLVLRAGAALAAVLAVRAVVVLLVVLVLLVLFAVGKRHTERADGMSRERLHRARQGIGRGEPHREGHRGGGSCNADSDPTTAPRGR